jgi:hypothetical protein
MDKVQKLAANQAHRDVKAARDSVRELIGEQATGILSCQDVVDQLPELLKKLVRAEGNMDVVLGRPRT